MPLSLVNAIPFSYEVLAFGEHGTSSLRSTAVITKDVTAEYGLEVSREGRSHAFETRLSEPRPFELK